jgi:hypothetical protein
MTPHTDPQPDLPPRRHGPVPGAAVFWHGRGMLLLALLPLVVTSGLPPSSTWRWSVVSGGGQAERVLLFFTGAAPPARGVTERWALSVGAPREDGKLPLSLARTGRGSPPAERYLAWEGPAGLVFTSEREPDEPPRAVVERRAPPRVLSMEQVPCTSALLGPGNGLCFGAAGGPLQLPELPVSLVLSEDVNAGTDFLKALAVGVLTAGVIIPGHTDHSVVATLDARPTARLAAELERWRKGPRTAAALERLAPSLDAEQAGALLVLAEKTAPALVEALTRRVAKEDRWPLLRLARQRRLSPPDMVSLVAKLKAADLLQAPGDTAQQELQDSALVGLDAPLAAALDGIVDERLPTLAAVARKGDAAALERAAAAALETAPLAPGEGVALALMLPVAARKKGLPRYVERLPTTEARLVVDSLLEDASPSERVRLLQRVPGWVDGLVLRGEAAELFKGLPFDDERVEVLQGTLTRASEVQRPAALVKAVALCSFDDGKLRLLRKWKGLPLTAPQRESVLASFFAGGGLDEGAQLLLSDADAASRTRVVIAWLAHVSDDRHRLELLRDQQQLAVTAAEARALFSSFGFPAGQAPAGALLLTLAPREEQPGLLVDFVKTISFDDGRLALLEAAPATAKRLSPAERKALLATFPFKAREAEALLPR